ncbi:MAG: 2-oxo-4-hydroxy-4-carboxy-5-ureidoimidazoline decarboxylase [Rhodomicrobium sp.]
MTDRIALAELNAMEKAPFVAAIGDVFEHADWVAEAAFRSRPFATVAALHAAMFEAVQAAPAETQLTFIRNHPELGGKVAKAGDLTEASKAEQGSLGLDRLSGDEYSRFEALNSAYKEKFGFPFVICVRRHTRDSVLAQFERRLAHRLDEERKTALNEIGFITRLRLVAKVEGPGAPKTDGRLSTHVLDNVTGKPARGVEIKLLEIGKSASGLLVETVTNSDGRTDSPLLSGAPLRIGTYELHFFVGGYFKAKAIATSEPPFLTEVPIRFSIAEPEGHYHVPLLITPWSYSTYRGS